MLSATLPSTLEPQSDFSCPAHSIGPEGRKELALRALAGESPSSLAEEADVSRKFIYQQKNRADQALDAEFLALSDDEQVLFHLPVTKNLIRQIIVALALVCRASLHGIQDFFRDICDHKISIGHIHNVIREAAAKAKEINSKEKLSPIRTGVNDEIFQSNQPVLVGLDPKTTYCYLLSLEEHRDATTWGVRLLELSKKGLAPDYTVADAGSGLRAGQALAWPYTPCWGDHFHALHQFTEVCRFQDNQAYRAMEASVKFSSKRENAKLIREGNKQTFDEKLDRVKAIEQTTVSMADDLRTLEDWLRLDIFPVIGPSATIRRELFDFVVSELQSLENEGSNRIRSLRVALQNQREELLMFADKMDQRIHDFSRKWQISANTARDLLKLSGCEREEPKHWQLIDTLRKTFGDKRHAVQHDLEKLPEGIVRASSLVENYNSRLRTYFELRKILGQEYLDLLRFFLNNRPYPRSRVEDRIEKTPAEMLQGRDLPSWLKQLGFEQFRQVA